MIRILKHSLVALLVATPLAFAQGDCSDCSDCTDCTDIDIVMKKKGVDCAAVTAKLVDARKDLTSWKREYKKLSGIERDTLRAAKQDLMTKDACMKALAPTFGAQADLLAALAAIEALGAKKETSNAKIATEMSNTYRAMAKALAGKKSYPAPSLKTVDEIKSVLKKAEQDATKAKTAWAAAKKAKLEKADADAIAAALKLMKQGSPRLRAVAKNADAVGKAFDGLDCGKANADGDPRPAVMKTAKELHALAAPYLDGVNLEKPKPMAPAPST
ncbi:MAG: hypothetical protein ACYTGZ_22585 [Planctomycetota bacterium]|jgi:hypothetical protein